MKQRGQVITETSQWGLGSQSSRNWNVNPKSQGIMMWRDPKNVMALPLIKVEACRPCRHFHIDGERWGNVSTLAGTEV